MHGDGDGQPYEEYTHNPGISPAADSGCDEPDEEADHRVADKWANPDQDVTPNGGRRRMDYVAGRIADPEIADVQARRVPVSRQNISWASS